MLIAAVSRAIGPEHAIRMYNNMRKDRVSFAPMEDQVSAGRRRAAYVEIQHMLRAGLLLCKDISAEPDDREFKANPNPPRRRRSRRGRSRSKSKEDKPKDAVDACNAGKTPAMEGSKGSKNTPRDPGKTALLGLIKDAEGLLLSSGEEKMDLAFHCRAICRIISGSQK
jgi:hypothetical protein